MMSKSISLACIPSVSTSCQADKQQQKRGFLKGTLIWMLKRCWREKKKGGGRGWKTDFKWGCTWKQGNNSTNKQQKQKQRPGALQSSFPEFLSSKPHWKLFFSVLVLLYLLEKVLLKLATWTASHQSYCVSTAVYSFWNQQLFSVKY